MKSIYQIPQKIKKITEHRQRKSIPMYNVLMPVLLFLILQYESFHTVFSAPESMEKRLKHCIKGRIPKIDAVRDVLSRTDPNEIREINTSVIRTIRENHIFQGGSLEGYMVAAIDGIELFSSKKKSCKDCLSRKLKTGETEYFHRSVVCGSVGSDPHIIFGQEMLHPRDGARKDEGELTGGKRLIRRLYREHGHFADIIVADALYLNAPFMNTVFDCGMDAVIRLKDTRRLIYWSAAHNFRKKESKKETFRYKNIRIEVWDQSGLCMDGVQRKLRVIKFREHYPRPKNKEEIREVWLVTSLKDADYKTLWKIMHKRWDIENNVFHQLKTYYHAKHCYCHAAIEVIFLLMILAFNMRELYLFRAISNLRSNKITRKSASRIFCDELLTETLIGLLYFDST